MESYLKENPHHRAPFIIILVCVIVVSLVYTVSVLIKPSSSVLTVKEQKEIVIDRLQNANTQPLSPQEKSNIINFVSRGGATYTEAEKAEITRILRSQ